MNNKVDFLPINIAIVTISDTRDLDNDKSGDVLAQRIEHSGHKTYEVRADGTLLTCEPAEELPLAQRYFLF